MRLITLLLGTFFMCTTVSFAQEEFVPEEIMDDHQYEFILYHLDGRFELHSCIADELYQDHLVRPSKEGERSINRGDSDGNPPMVVTGGQWIDDCLIVHYDKSELPDSEWVNWLVTITKLSPNQIKIVHQ